MDKQSYVISNITRLSHARTCWQLAQILVPEGFSLVVYSPLIKILYRVTSSPTLPDFLMRAHVGSWHKFLLAFSCVHMLAVGTNSCTGGFLFGCPQPINKILCRVKSSPTLPGLLIIKYIELRHLQHYQVLAFSYAHTLAVGTNSCTGGFLFGVHSLL